MIVPKQLNKSRIIHFFRRMLAGKSTRLATLAIIQSGLITLIVKALGFVREMLIAFYFGVSETIDNYVLLILALTFFVAPVSGSFGTLLTPRYIQFLDNKQLSFAASLFKKTLITITLFVIIVEFLQILMIRLLPSAWTLGLAALFESYWLALVPIALFSAISTVTGGILVGQGRVKTFTCLPATVTISIIVSLVLFSSTNLLLALIFGTLAGFAFEMLANLIAVRKLLLNSQQGFLAAADNFRGMLAKMPMLVGSAIVMNTCIIVDQVMAVLAGPGSVAAVSFGNRLSLGLISITAVIWVVLYPVFSRLVSQKNFNQLRRQLFENAILVLLIGVPICGVIACFSPEITRLLFERGQFDPAATTIVSEIQMFYVLHIPLYVVVMICMKVANAFQNNDYLMTANLLLLALNVIFNLLFIEWIGVAGIALATLVAYSVMVICWLIIVSRLISSQQSY